MFGKNKKKADRTPNGEIIWMWCAQCMGRQDHERIDGGWECLNCGDVVKQNVAGAQQAIKHTASKHR